MSFAEAQYTIDSLLDKLKTGQLTGLPPLPPNLSSTGTSGVNWENQRTTMLVAINVNGTNMVAFPHKIDSDIFKDTVVSGKKLATLGGVRGELMLRSQVINKETRPGDGLFCFECSIEEYLSSDKIYTPYYKDGINMGAESSKLINQAVECPSSDGSSESEFDNLALKLYTFSDKGVYCYDQNHYIEYMLIPISPIIAPPTLPTS